LLLVFVWKSYTLAEKFFRRRKKMKAIIFLLGFILFIALVVLFQYLAIGLVAAIIILFGAWVAWLFQKDWVLKNNPIVLCLSVSIFFFALVFIFDIVRVKL